MSQLTIPKTRNIDLPGFTLTPVGVNIVGRPTLDEWREAMQFVKRANNGVQFWLGDMLRWGYTTYGEEASSEDHGYEYGTKRNAKWVAEQVPLSLRNDKLSFNHHAAVAPLSHAEQKAWLDAAEANDWAYRELRNKIADARVAKTVAETPLPKGKYNLIYADPPWRYDFAASNSRKIENQYPTMEVEDICGLEVSKLAADDCVLFLWATSPKLREAFQVIDTWGFEYKTCMIWRKDKIGMGYYARQQHELLLIATCGTPAVPAEAVRPASVIDAPRGEHSAKPVAFYELIEQMYPNAKRIELFSRSPRQGWKVWGNEVPLRAAA